MNKKIFTFIIIALTIFHSSCVDTINYELKKETEKIVISGQLSDSLEAQVITIEKSVLLDKEASSRAEPIVGATVKIVSDNQEILFTEKEKGRYVAITKGETNESYKLIVENEGEIYESSIEKMPSKGNGYSSRTVYFVEDILTKAGNLIKEQKVVLLASGELADDDYYYIRTSGEYEFKEFNPMSTGNKSCYIPVLLDQLKVTLLSKEILNGNKYSDFPFNKSDISDYYFTNFCYHISQYKISKKTYEYWRQVQQVLTTGSGLFEAPPGKLLGNIKNINKPEQEVIGYFTVAAVNSSKAFTNGFKLGVKVTDPCGFVFNRPRPQSCNQCLVIPNSTSIKPSYWP